MKRLSLVILLIAFVLAGCRLVTPEHPYFSAHEIELLFPEASERWVYFYGDPMTIELEGERLVLEPAGDEPSPWALPGALWVNGMPLWREVLPPVRPEVKASYDPFAGAYVLETEAGLIASWYYDGETWWRLSGPVPAGKEVLRVPEEGGFRPSGLTPDEVRVVRRELELRARGRPLVVFQRTGPVHRPYRFEPRPWVHRLASLRVQRGVPRRAAPALPWRVLKTGSYAAYKGRAPMAYLACSPRGVAELWDLAYGNRLPKAAPPVLEPGRCLAGFFWGLKPTGGYRIEVRGGRVSRRVAEFALELKAPPPGALTTQALTSPFVLIELFRPVDEVRFVDPDGKLLARALAD